jgi:glutamine phosphoribosylpyrophosphate amidotransferase
MQDPETGNCIAFNGEIYNFQELRRDCERRGERFRSHTDTEVILALYRRYGPSSLGQLRGMFAFAHQRRVDEFQHRSLTEGVRNDLRSPALLAEQPFEQVRDANRTSMRNR